MRRGRLGAMAIAGGLVVTAACGSSGGSAGSPTPVTAPGGPCPVEPLRVVVSVNQWADVVEQLGGGCTEVTTIVEGADVDPHDFEPTPADRIAFDDADLVVVNGLGYDQWAVDAVSSSGSPAVVDGGEVVGLTEGDDPHLWYSPTHVQQVSAAVTAELRELEPGAASYFEDRAADWDRQLQPYLDEVAALKASSAGRTYTATESVFDAMAAAIGLVDLTPPGYRNAATNESEPAPGDVKAFEDLLGGGTVDVLVYNTQTEGSVPEQLRAAAERAGVPVVEVTESVPASQSSFVTWQLDQLEALGAALRG